jgi:glycosyltransferase involved in cell wall biosynthesis
VWLNYLWLNNDVDIYHANFKVYKTFPKKPRKTILTLHDLNPILFSEDPKIRRKSMSLTKKVIDIADMVITVSNFSKRQICETFNIPESKVRVVYNGCGVPHIFAESDSDAFFILGYIQAHFRLFQMDMSRRASTGRLAEIFPEMLTQDIIQRMLGFKFISEKTLESFKDIGMLKKVQAFVDGINQYIDDAREGREFGGLKPRIPLQYQILKKEPQYFGVVDVIAIGKKRAFDLSGGGGIFDIASKLVEIIFGEDFEKKFSLSAVEKTKIVDDLPKVRITPFSISESDEPRKFASKLKSYELKSEDIKKIKPLQNLYVP